MPKSNGSKAIIAISIIASIAIISTSVGIVASHFLKDGIFSGNTDEPNNSSISKVDNTTKVDVIDTPSDNTTSSDTTTPSTEKENEPSTPQSDDIITPSDDPDPEPEPNPEPVTPEEPKDKEEEKEDEGDDGTIRLKYKEGGIYVDDTFYSVAQLVDGGYINFDANGVLKANPSKLNNFNNFILTIPEGITKIYQNAFKGCEKLTKVYFPTSLVEIGNSAFYNCTALETAKLLPTINKVGDYAFSYTSLKRVFIPSVYTNVNLTAFWWLGKVEKITVEEGHSKYDSRDNCNAIVETSTNTIVYGCEKTLFVSSIKKIGEGAFMTCKGYMRFTIPESIEEIGKSAFENSNIMTVTIKNNNVKLGDKIFYSCKELYYARFPDGVEEIPNSCFCESPYATFEFPKNLKRIGSYAFYENEDFCRYKITIPGTVTYIGEYAFYGAYMTELVFVDDYYNPLVEIGNSAFENCKNIKSDKLVVPSVKTIGKNAFNGCENVKSISIPNNVQYIGPFSLDVGKNKKGDIVFSGDKDTLDSIPYNYYKGSSRIKCMW